MSWATADLRLPILEIFSEAHSFVFQDAEFEHTKAFLKRQAEAARDRWKFDKRHRDKINARNATPEAKAAAHERYLNNRGPLKRKPKTVRRCQCGEQLSQSATRCERCWRGEDLSARAIELANGGLSERAIAQELGINRSKVHRYLVKVKCAP